MEGNKGGGMNWMYVQWETRKM